MGLGVGALVFLVWNHYYTLKIKQQKSNYKKLTKIKRQFENGPKNEHIIDQCLAAIDLIPNSELSAYGISYKRALIERLNHYQPPSYK